LRKFNAPDRRPTSLAKITRPSAYLCLAELSPSNIQREIRKDSGREFYGQAVVGVESKGDFRLKNPLLLRCPEFLHPSFTLHLLTSSLVLSANPSSIHSSIIMSRKPTLVLVPGAWHSASTWVKVASLLETQQYKCVGVSLPSATANPSATFLEDLKAVRSAIVAETSQGRDVVVVVHSYGGIVGSSAIKGLTQEKQDGTSSAKDPSGHVIGFIM
jgi:hypothetical protein